MDYEDKINGVLRLQHPVVIFLKLRCCLKALCFAACKIVICVLLFCVWVFFYTVAHGGSGFATGYIGFAAFRTNGGF